MPAYFTVRTQDLLITFNYFAAMKADFLPVFEKIVGSIVIK
jgi:hypothetical protein